MSKPRTIRVPGAKVYVVSPGPTLSANRTNILIERTIQTANILANTRHARLTPWRCPTFARLHIPKTLWLLLAATRRHVGSKTRIRSWSCRGGRIIDNRQAARFILSARPITTDSSYTTHTTYSPRGTRSASSSRTPFAPAPHQAKAYQDHSCKENRIRTKSCEHVVPTFPVYFEPAVIGCQQKGSKDSENVSAVDENLDVVCDARIAGIGWSPRGNVARRIVAQPKRPLEVRSPHSQVPGAYVTTVIPFPHAALTGRSKIALPVASTPPLLTELGTLGSHQVVGQHSFACTSQPPAGAFL